METLKILSLGAGVQSSTVLLMSCVGELPKLDAAIFADTRYEPPAVYEHLAWLETEAEKAGIPVHRVSRGDLRQDAIDFRQLRASADGKRFASIPLFILNPNGSHGMVRRQCTSEYKVEPIEKFIKRELLGLKPKARAPIGAVDHWFGISADELRRVRISRDAWQRNVYPLCNLPEQFFPKGLVRKDCVSWLESHYPARVVPRSACIACPFHSDTEWRRMRDEDPESFADAVAFDEQIRIADQKGQSEKRMLTGIPFIHASRRPLGEVDFSTAEERGQRNWLDECTGMCGV